MSTMRSLMWKTAAGQGLVVGSLLVVLALVVWKGGLEESSWIKYANWLIIIGSVYYCMTNWRDKHMGGAIKYSQALGYGVAVMFMASIVFGFYNIIYMNYLDTDSIQRSLDLLEESYYEMGFSEDRIELAMEMATSMQTPFVQALSAIMGTTFLGFIVSLIVALFVRREGDPFQDAMKNVNNPSEESI